MLISLPEDILYTIFNYLDVQDVLTLRQVPFATTRHPSVASRDN